MRIGTKSVLFGVHQFLWHPIVVALAWRKLYFKWPTFDEAIALVLHDIGYIGRRDMDGPDGLLHPVDGAEIARGVVFLLHRDAIRAQRAYDLCIGHSCGFAKLTGKPVSKLCAPDKCSLLFEPWWFYKLRATLSGELSEYVNNAPYPMTPRQWFIWMKRYFRRKYVPSSSGEVDSGSTVPPSASLVESRGGPTSQN